MLPAAIEAMTAQLGPVGNASSLHASGRHARRVVEESRETIAPASLPAARGRLHLRWDRVRQPRPQGLSTGHAAPRTRGAPASCPRRSSTMPSSTRWTGSPARGRRCRAAARRPARSARPRRAARGRRTRPDERRADLGDVGQQRGRHLAADRRGRRRWPREHGIPVHTDAVQAVGQVPLDFAAIRRRRDDGDRTQDRWPLRRRRPRAASRGRADAAAARRRPGARRAVRHHRHPRHRGFAAAAELAVKGQAEHARAWRRCATS